MTPLAILKKIFCTEKAIIEEIIPESDKFIVYVRIPKRVQNRCPHCGRKCPGYDFGSGYREWRGVDVAGYRVLIRAVQPRITCPIHGIVTSCVPWARHKSRFTYEFEQTVTWLTKHMAMSAVCQFMQTQFRTVGAIVKRVFESSQNANRFLNLEAIGIDETSYKKGYKYFMTVVDHNTGKIIWAHEGFGEGVLRIFFEQLTPEQRAKIRYVTADGARYIADLVAQYCPKAKRCLDRYHVVSWATDAIDEIRRGLWRDAQKAAKSKNATSEDKAAAKAIKNTRYAVLKNPEHLTESQLATLELQVKSNPFFYIRRICLKRNFGLRSAMILLKPKNRLTDSSMMQKTAAWLNLPRFLRRFHGTKNLYLIQSDTACRTVELKRLTTISNVLFASDTVFIILKACFQSL